MKLIAIVAASSLIAGAVVIAQTGQTRSTDNDWPMFSHDFGGTRFSPLTDINADNAATLAQAWSVQLTQPAGRRGGGAPPAEGAPPQGRGGGRGRAGGAAAAGEEGEAAGSNPEVTPIVINGVMYLPARGNQVLALDGDTGKEIWRYQMPPTITTTARGVAYWPGEANIPPRIILSAGPRLLALDAATGQPAAGFGRNGMIELPRQRRQAIRRRRRDRHARRLLAALVPCFQGTSLPRSQDLIKIRLTPEFIAPMVSRSSQAVTLVDSISSGRCRGV